MLKRVVLITVVVVMMGAFFTPNHQVEASHSCTQTHTVQYGQNLFRIGLMYGVQWPVLQQWNHLPNPNVIRVGQVLCVSGPAHTAPPTNPPIMTNTGTTVYPGNPFGPTTDPRVFFPEVQLDQQFQLRGYNFPANTQVTISLTTLGNQNYQPYYTATTNPQGEFFVLVGIPAVLANASTIAVDVRTANGYYARNWFYN